MRETFFSRPELDDELPFVNEAFWSALIEHIENDLCAPRKILDIGCHTGGLLLALSQRFPAAELLGIEPLGAARSAASRQLANSPANVSLFDSSQWRQIASASVDLVTSHEVLYLEPDLRDFMARVRGVLGLNGVAYIVLGCHAENPLWQDWKPSLIAAGNRVYDHSPLGVMEAASASGLLPSVQPLRRSGWVTYDPLRAAFRFPNMQTMLDHHYRHKLIFRLRVANERTTTS